MESPDLTQANIDKIAALFPGAITEAKDENGNLKRAINFELLKQFLSSDVVDDDEAYEFTWVGKKASIVEAGKPIRKTLRPCKEESKNWEDTENLYIEGDNLDVLKLLQESYLGKVKMIYIDPPYNTGNDFIYRDNFTMAKDEYDEEAGVYDEEGDKLFRNTESNGRFHSDWCSMMYPRLVLARNLLSDDGVIFISIDDGEIAQLRKICDEIFGEDNFTANAIWQKKFSRANDATYFSTMHDNILCYAKKSVLYEKNGWKIGLLPRGSEIPEGYSNPDDDPRGVWTSVIFSAKSGSEKLIYEITSPGGAKHLPPSGRFWSVNPERFTELVNDKRIWFGKNGNSSPRYKTFLSEVQAGLRPNTILFHEEAGHNQEGKQETKAIFDGTGVFDGPKPVRLLKLLLKISNCGPNNVILDFFSGSATTAHAVMQLNAEDGGNRKFIMVQLPEECPLDSEAAKAGYVNICEIGKERIRRAGEKIKIDNADKDGIENLDVGFRVLKLDSTNMKDVYYGAGDYDQGKLTDLISNIKDDRDDMDLLYGCLLEWGLPLSLSHTSEQIDGVTVHTYNNGDLIACFAPKVSETVVREIAKRKPLRVVFRDSSFADAPAKINVEEIFKLMAPNTTVKVI